MADHDDHHKSVQKHSQVHIHNIPQEIFQMAVLGGSVGLVTAICKGYFESRIIVDPKLLPPPGLAARRMLTWPLFYGGVSASYAIAKHLSNAVRGVHDRDWITSFSGGFTATGIAFISRGIQLFPSLGAAISLGLVCAFVEGPFMKYTNLVQKTQAQYESRAEPYARYRALGQKSKEQNDHHLAEIERAAIQILEENEAKN